METSTATNIKIELLRIGVTQSEIANRLKVSVGSVNDVISGRRITPRIRTAIANAIGKPVEKIWPPTQEKAA